MVAALPVEVEPLIRGWAARRVEHEGKNFRVFERGNASLVCGGIGAEPARRATEAMIRTMAPDLLLSVGFAGALDSGLRVGDIVEPRTVINARDGSRTLTGSSKGILVTTSQVTEPGQKAKLRDLYGADVVDMEAASVAQGAAARGVKFGAVKVVSDELGFTLPPVSEFVAPEGNFLTRRFAWHVAVRPWMWPATISLARNSRKAARALSLALENYLANLSMDGSHA